MRPGALDILAYVGKTEDPSTIGATCRAWEPKDAGITDLTL